MSDNENKQEDGLPEKGSRAGDGGSSGTRIAVWRPGWFELDQPIHVGQQAGFTFYESVPDDYKASRSVISSSEVAEDNCEIADGNGAPEKSEEFEFAFFNQLDDEADSQVRNATVVDITHFDLGPLRSIETCGLDYFFMTLEGEQIVVNAEEKPGRPVDESIKITDWRVRVTLTDVSDPVTDHPVNDIA